MDSRQRVLSAINHQEPDRIPVDLGATPSSGISAIAYAHLKRHLGMRQGHTRVYDVVQQLAQPEDAILDRFGIDVLDIGRSFNTRDEDWYDFDLPQGIRVQFPAWFKPLRQPTGAWDVFDAEGMRVATMPRGAAFFDQTCFPYIDGYPDDYTDLERWMGKVHWSGLAHSPWDHAGEPDFWVALRRRALDLRRSSDRALVVVAGCNLFEWGTFLRRIDHFLMDLIDDQRGVERLLDALLERHLGTLEKVCQAVGDVADIIRFGDDLGTDSGPFMSPAIYRKLFKPRHKLLTGYVKTAQPDAHLPALLRLDLPPAAGPDRGRLRDHQPGANQQPRHAARASEARIWQGTDLLGRGRGYAPDPEPGHPGPGQR